MKLRIRAMTALRLSAVLTLLGLVLMVWSMLQPTVLPVMLAMTVGQGIGCMAFGLYLYVVIRDVRRARRVPAPASAAPASAAPASAAPASAESPESRDAP